MSSKNKAWVISVDMGYGHQRAAYPLKDIAYERIITANSDKIITVKEKKTWHRLASFYEGVSRMRSFPIIGEILWRIYDKIQSISPYYPLRDLSKPSLGSKYMHRLIKKGIFKSIVEYTKEKKIPFISTYFVPALAAAHEKLKDVYCVVTDTDINRAWVPEHPKKDKLYYLTPTEHSTKRLIAYGVPKKNIFFTGFPLPKENLGRNLELLKKDLGERLPNLDPHKIYISKYKAVIKNHLGKYYRTKSTHPLTLTLVIGGAGAQKETVATILKSLKAKIKKNEIRINLIAGTRLEIEQYFKDVINNLNLTKKLGESINILCTLNKKSHFEEFNKLLHETDILWTKPSELSFYTALGLPIIIAPPLGAHEILNQKWLVRMGTGFRQEDPAYVNEWFSEWIDKGFLAEAALEGFLEAPKYGIYNIEKVLFSKNKNNLKFKY
jgi:hypothetical protein